MRDVGYLCLVGGLIAWAYAAYLWREGKKDKTPKKEWYDHDDRHS